MNRIMRLESSIAIHRPPEVVWAYLGNVSNLPEWDRGVARAIETREKPAAAHRNGAGYEFHTETHAQSPDNSHDKGRMAYRVASVDPEAQRCTVDLTSITGNARFFRRAQWIFHVTPTLSGSRVTCAVEFTLRPAYFFMAPVLYLTRSAIHSDLERLKRAIESIAATPERSSALRN
jgi:carbon monoxide dehydrogenase subunit G